MTLKWKEVKDEILRLYIMEGKPLVEVRKELERTRNFKASIRAYKIKLEEWGFYKYKRRQKDDENEINFPVEKAEEGDNRSSINNEDMKDDDNKASLQTKRFGNESEFRDEDMNEIGLLVENFDIESGLHDEDVRDGEKETGSSVEHTSPHDYSSQGSGRKGIDCEHYEENNNFWKNVRLSPEPRSMVFQSSRDISILNTKCLERDMSWSGISARSSIRDDVVMSGLSLSPSSYQTQPSYKSISSIPKLEARFMRDFSCCGKTLPSLHDLLQHYEEVHAPRSSASIDSSGLSNLAGSQGRSERPRSPLGG